MPKPVYSMQDVIDNMIEDLCAEAPSHRKSDGRGCPSTTPLGGTLVEDQREHRRFSTVRLNKRKK